MQLETGSRQAQSSMAGSVTRAERIGLDLLVDGFLRALGDGDVAGLLSTMTDDIEYEVVGSPSKPVRGKEAVRGYHLREFANTMQERVVPLRRLYGNGFVVDELVWEGRITGRIGPAVGNGRRVTQRVLRVFEVRDGQMARQTIYEEHTAITRQLS